MSKPATTTIRCPKCRSRSFRLLEYIVNTTEWTVTDGMLDRADGIHEMGEYFAVKGRCPCGHQWKLRNTTGIDQVVTELPRKTSVA